MDMDNNMHTHCWQSVINENKLWGKGLTSPAPHTYIPIYTAPKS